MGGINLKKRRHGLLPTRMEWKAASGISNKPTQVYAHGEILRERGFSEAEIAEAERLDRQSSWLIGATVAVLLISVGLYVWQTVAAGDAYRPGETIEERGAVSTLGRATGTVADFFRPKPPKAEADAQVDPSEPAVFKKTTARPRVEKAPTDAPAVAPLIVYEQPQLAVVYQGPEKRAVRRDTVRALKSGDARLWEHGGKRGYVLVSDSAEYEGKPCRQVSYSLIPETGQQVVSDPVQWCDFGRNRWRESPLP